MKVLHITSWYPTTNEPYAALFIWRQIAALSEFEVDSKVYHLEVVQGKWGLINQVALKGNRIIKLSIPISHWRIKQWISSILVLLVLLKNASKFDLINFHIAYPLCTYIGFYKKLFQKPFLISEHWSAYHYNFGIKNSEDRQLIQDIFKNKIPVAAVSSALIQDIKKFSTYDFRNYVIPNIINTSIFKYEPKTRNKHTSLFMVGKWQPPKQPLLVLEALLQIPEKITLYIGGYGSQYQPMLDFVSTNNMEEYVKFIGPMKSEKIAAYMQLADYYIHPSNYETFSVVCAEALCCGTPLIVYPIGGIKEFTHANNAILLPKLTLENMKKAILKATKTPFEHQKIAKEAQKKFSINQIGSQYYKILKEECILQSNLKVVAS